MTLAVLFAASESPEPLSLPSGEPLARRLRDQLRHAGARDVATAGSLAEVARLADAAGEAILLCADDLVAHAAVLRHLATSPVGPTVALVLPEPASGGQAGIREDRGRVAAVGPGGTGTFGGALRVGPEDLPALATAARTAAAQSGGAGTALDRLLTALSGTGITIFAHRVRLLVARRVADPAAVAAAEAAVAAVPSDQAELRLAVKERDDFFTTYFVSTWSVWVTRLAARIGIGPTGVTAVSVLFALAAAALFGLGGRPALVTGAVLLYLGFVLDCVDGQLARYTRQFSPWGGWLDTMADRAKEYVVYAGLAVGVERAGLGNGWALAIAAITLQTVRHMTDAWYGVLHDAAVRRPVPSAGPAGNGGAGGVDGVGGVGGRLGRASTRVQADTGSPFYWLKRTVVFPIGERWALIALTVAVFDPRVSLIAVLVWGALAAGYTLCLRTLRARSMRVPALAGVDTSLHRDDGPLARALGAVGRRLARPPGPLPLALVAAGAGAALLLAAVAGAGGGDLRWAAAGALLLALGAGLPASVPHTGALDWLVPAALRAAEYLYVIAVGVGAGVPPPLTFALLFVLALHHYDLTARLEKNAGRPPLHSWSFGWDGRLVLLAAGVFSGLSALVVPALAAYLFLVLVSSAVAGWTHAGRSNAGRAAGRGRAIFSSNGRRSADQTRRWPVGGGRERKR